MESISTRLNASARTFHHKCQPKSRNDIKNSGRFLFLNFDDHIFKTIAHQTNASARNRISSIMCGRDPIQQLNDPTNKKHNHLHSWKDINAANIKLFMAHVIVMSLVQKFAVHGYWSRKTLSHAIFWQVLIT